MCPGLGTSVYVTGAPSRYPSVSTKVGPYVPAGVGRIILVRGGPGAYIHPAATMAISVAANSASPPRPSVYLSRIFPANLAACPASFILGLPVFSALCF